MTDHTPRPWRRLSPDEKRIIEAMHVDGASFSDIAAATGRRWQTIQAYLLRAGLYEPVHSRSTPEARDRAVAWYGRGVKTDVIERRCGLSSKTLYGELRRRGVALRLPQRVTQ